MLLFAPGAPAVMAGKNEIRSCTLFFRRPPIGADIETEAADRWEPRSFPIPEVLVACHRIEPCFAGFVPGERPASECMYRADIHTGSASSAPGFHGQAGGRQRGIGEDRDPADPRAMVRSHEQAALPDPPESGQV